MRIALKIVDNTQNFNCDTLVVALHKDKKLGSLGKQLDKASGKSLSRLLRSERFSGNRGEALVLPLVEGIKAGSIVLWGLGEASEVTRQNWSAACQALAAVVLKQPGGHCALLTDSLKARKDLPLDWALQQVSINLVSQGYRYQTTKASTAKKAPPQIKQCTALTATSELASAKAKAKDKDKRTGLKRGAAIGEGINIARELGNLPGNVCTPKYLASEARKLGRKYDAVSTSVLGERQMRELGMGSLLSVGEGSDQESQLIVINYKGGKRGEQPQVLVGKGITFDTGGISLKPGGKMDEMKFDMCGAASVMGTLSTIAALKLPVNVIGVIAAAENMPSGRATKPGDVVTSMAGKTIEVLNTDAEGRLVLCDALHYVKRFKPAAVVDMATLTGACIVALGHHATGLMSNDDKLADELLAAGTESADRAWRLPLWEEYHKQLQSPFADLANIGGPSAGTITAGCFLAQFAEDYPWAHLDIAGTAWNQGGGKGASGRPVALLCQYLFNQAAK